MADDKTFTEEQHLAILADRVAKETAALTEQLQAAETRADEAESKLDTEAAAKVAAEQAAEKAAKDFEEFKAEQERTAEIASRTDERLALVKEAAAHMPDEFFADEKRVARIVAMEQEAFDGYLGDLKAAAPAVTPGAPPRETAMHGAPGTGGAPAGAGSAASTVLLGRFGRGASEKGA